MKKNPTNTALGVTLGLTSLTGIVAAGYKGIADASGIPVNPDLVATVATAVGVSSEVLGGAVHFISSKEKSKYAYYSRFMPKPSNAEKLKQAAMVGAAYTVAEFILMGASYGSMYMVAKMIN